MEKAIHLETPDAIPSGYDRLYFGAEFCERSMPDVAQTSKAIGLAAKHSLKFSLVTPFLTDACIRKIICQVRLLKGLPGSEVVINDLGILNTVAKLGITPVLGRLLTKQKRGPRIACLQRYREVYDHYRSVPVLSRASEQYIAEMGFRRLELDNVAQGIISDAQEMALSLHYPYVYVSTTRLCPFSDGRNCTSCRPGHVLLKNRHMPLPIILKGNTYYYRNDKLPDKLEAITRLVYHPW
ncbi:MAG: hypothetical protein ABH879_08095 [archaeon]